VKKRTLSTREMLSAIASLDATRAQLRTIEALRDWRVSIARNTIRRPASSANLKAVGK
jgi:hypothetical protein